MKDTDTSQPQGEEVQILRI